MECPDPYRSALVTPAQQAQLGQLFYEAVLQPRGVVVASASWSVPGTLRVEAESLYREVQHTDRHLVALQLMLRVPPEIVRSSAQPLLLVGKPSLQGYGLSVTVVLAELFQ
jgi:hypothetical protein